MYNKKLINIASVIIGLAGIFGMLFCFPFLWSANMADLVGAGFPFVGGALLVGTSLISLSINNKK
jgi:hypothetical protein